VVVDDNPTILYLVQDICRNSSTVEIVRTFYNPLAFVEEVHKIDFDVCLLDIFMSKMDGFAVAQRIKEKQIIYITGEPELLKEAANKVEPVDVVFKPIRKERLERAFEKAKLVLSATKDNSDYKLFYVAETKGQVKIKMNDIVFVGTDKIDHRNKCIVLRSGEKYTIMDCTLAGLLTLSNNLVQVNKSELISPEIFHKIEYDEITLDIKENGRSMQTTLSRVYKEEFKVKFNIK
jgi:DNA-binding LytR/AlgR family response regulator